MNNQLNLDLIYVSKYSTVKSTLNEKVSLTLELQRIKNGFYETPITQCRQAYSTDYHLYQKLKSNLPAVTFSGVFASGHKKENLIQYNNIIVIDLDNLSSQLLIDAKSQISSDKYVFACWESPSGNGLKALVALNSQYQLHKHNFDRIYDHFYAEYGLSLDISGSDYSRLCFVSHDNSTVMNFDAERFPKIEDEWLLEYLASSGCKITNLRAMEDESLGKLVLETDKQNFYSTEGRNGHKNRRTIANIISFLTKSNQSVTSSYSNWLKVGFSVANSFTYDLGEEIFLKLCRLDGKNHHENKSVNMLQHCYRKRIKNKVNFATLIYMAAQKGFKI